MYCVYIHFPMRVQKIPGYVQNRPLHVQKCPIKMYQNSMCVPRSPEHSQNSPFYVQKNPSRTHFPRCEKISWLKFNEKEPFQSDASQLCWMHHWRKKKLFAHGIHAARTNTLLLAACRSRANNFFFRWVFFPFDFDFFLSCVYVREDFLGAPMSSQHDAHVQTTFYRRCSEISPKKNER